MHIVVQTTDTFPLVFFCHFCRVTFSPVSIRRRRRRHRHIHMLNVPSTHYLQIRVSVYFIYEVVRPCRFPSTICIYDMMWHVCINVRFFLLFFIVTFDGTTPSTTATTGNSAKMWTFRRQRNNGTSSHFFVYCLTWIFARSILIKMSVILAPRARAIERSITLSFFLSSEMSSMRDSKFCINIFIGLS